jgi:hypothetical protein
MEASVAASAAMGADSQASNQQLKIVEIGCFDNAVVMTWPVLIKDGQTKVIKMTPGQEQKLFVSRHIRSVTSPQPSQAFV